MRLYRHHPLSLLELILAMSLFCAIATAAIPVLLLVLRIEAETNADLLASQTCGYLMQRIQVDLRRSTEIIKPSQLSADSSKLEFITPSNADGDCFFGDPLFPRSNEDLTGDRNGDGAPGVAGIDDDGDGLVDEGDRNDDDEDGSVDEDPETTLTFTFNPGSGTISESASDTGSSTVVARNISDFRARLLSEDRMLLTVQFQQRLGRVQTFQQVVHLRNIRQRTGVWLQ